MDDFKVIETDRGLATDLVAQLPHGVHSRPSARISQLARSFISDISLVTEAGEADAKSMLNILSLAIQCNAPVRIIAAGPDAREALASIRAALLDTETWRAR